MYHAVTAWWIGNDDSGLSPLASTLWWFHFEESQHDDLGEMYRMTRSMLVGMETLTESRHFSTWRCKASLTPVARLKFDFAQVIDIMETGQALSSLAVDRGRLGTMMTIIDREVCLPEELRRSSLTAESPEMAPPERKGFLKRWMVASGQRCLRWLPCWVCRRKKGRWIMAEDGTAFNIGPVAVPSFSLYLGK